jgi:hypothetical protein
MSFLLLVGSWIVIGAVSALLFGVLTKGQIHPQ